MALSCATAQDVLKTIKDKNVQMIDLRFTDFRPAKRGGR
jgi:hypothetical protein